VITRISRPYWVVGQLALLGIAAWVLASGISGIVQSRLQRSSDNASVGVTPTKGATKVRPVSEYLIMTKRDLFAAPSDEPDLATVGGSLPSGPTDMRLLGTGGSGAAGFAIVENKSGKEQVVVGIGEELNGAELTQIGWRRAVLRRAGVEELLIVPPDVAVETAKKTTKRTSKNGNIQELGDDRWMVAQTEVQHQLENLGSLFTQMRAVPNMKDGAANGFRIFAIRRNSLFQKLGLKNNDVVQRVNGMDLNDPARAMGLLEDLKGETRLTIDVLRGKEPRTLTYEIR
jgi:general secretion pathway protein C